MKTQVSYHPNRGNQEPLNYIILATSHMEVAKPFNAIVLRVSLS